MENGACELLTPKYYDGTKLLSLKDMNGKEPSIYVCATNRSAGKTTFFSRLLFRKYLRKNHQFLFLYRYKYEMDSVKDKIWTGIAKFFPGWDIELEVNQKIGFGKFFLIKEVSGEKQEYLCGYITCLNSADQIKKYSHVFHSVEWIFMDEFQSETDKYCQDEIIKFLSIYMSVARGKGKQFRDVKVILAGNHISLDNPYYTYLGINKRLKPETKFMRGKGWVMEFGYYDGPAEEIKNSNIGAAFADSDYFDNLTSKDHLLCDNYNIAKCPSNVKYLATFKTRKVRFSVKYNTTGMYVCESFDITRKTKICPNTLSDGDYESISNFPYLHKTLKEFYKNGKIYYENNILKGEFFQFL